MRGLREAVAVLRIGLKVLWFVVLFVILPATAVLAQASVNDIHVEPRHMPSAVANVLASNKLVGESLLHVVKTDVKLVLVPVTVTDPKQRLVTGLQAGIFPAKMSRFRLALFWIRVAAWPLKWFAYAKR